MGGVDSEQIRCAGKGLSERIRPRAPILRKLKARDRFNTQHQAKPQATVSGGVRKGKSSRQKKHVRDDWPNLRQLVSMMDTGCWLRKGNQDLMMGVCTSSTIIQAEGEIQYSKRTLVAFDECIRKLVAVEGSQLG